MTDLKCEKFFTFSPCTVTRGHEYKLVPLACHCDVRKYYFAGRVVYNWNSLNPYLTNYSNLHNFKASLKHYNFRDTCIGKL